VFLNKYEKLTSFAEKLNSKILLNEPMRNHTTFKIGGPADILIVPTDELSIALILRFCKTEKIATQIVGNGSNLLVSDDGIRGAVIKINDAIGKIQMIDDKEEIEFGAGVKLSTACTFAADKELSGMEFAYGIPGTIGGAVYMNAGAYDSEMSMVVSSVRYIDSDFNIQTIHSEKLDFGYRHSFFINSNNCILSVIVVLKQAPKDEILAKMNKFIGQRKEKQPLEYPSAGSVFKRPVGHYAGNLIERCGLKGMTVGGAMVSEKHAGFIINTNNATAKDVKELIHLIKDKVFEQTGVRLECEIKYIGE
jgi:UDP-N-acetylmuramate dehydrogenase